ncbi:MAG: hypothetical protein GQ574_13525 [Crocinitomix sp.]|nr:hypothetical protein [Crocinitomix sp.]
MRLLSLFVFISLFMAACSGPEDDSDDIVVDAEISYCDCKELAFDLPYNNFYLNEPRKGFTGLCENFYSNGELSLSKNFYKGKVHGDFTTYYESGNVQETKEFDMSFQSGDHFIYTEDGTLLYHAKYKWGKQTEVVFQAN